MNFEQSIAYIEDYMETHGPFDDLLGFSQGAFIAAASPGMQAEGVAFTKVPKIKFVILIVGAKFLGFEFRQPKLVVNAFSSPVQCPSLHIIVPERVRVAVRLWPRNAEETVADVDFADCIELQTELKRLKLRKNNWNSDTYEFDEVFTEFVSQKCVYEVVAKPVVEQQQQQWQRPWRRGKIKWPISLLV
ncbi:uncharacterized protein LOC18039093 isoform X1 [Citrus clementina]|uniref:uncharacterized protein LOC18039093 isoform X1 n=1 Tax=Citrus clementina TaxID=85681 RepID=UPI000CED03F4|nr:uncharacterized protein LOC18039093 isoform X1 [Citrus x clementina]XP_024038491.1 uncharacterized protein LOC18039093 isoform X1 [Citrus x clementina]